MNDRDVEVACWRIWNYMQLYGENIEYSQKKLTNELGLYPELTEKAIETMRDVGVVIRTERGYKLDQYEDAPPFTPIFPTFTGEQDNV